MTSSFVKRRIDVTFIMGTGQFGEDGSDTVKLTGLRVSAAIVKNGGLGMGEGHFRIFGMRLDTMNRLSTLGLLPNGTRSNFVLVEAGDDVVGMTPVFRGLINDAYVDLNGAPDACLNVLSNEGSWEAVRPTPPTSFAGSTDVATIVSGLAATAGLAFEDSGVRATVTDQYLPGTARQQIYAVAAAANVNVVIDRGTVAIWPRGGARAGSVPVVAPDSGLQGYPTFTSNGVQIVCLFLPYLEFGAAFELRSSLTPANRTWVVQRLEYNLESESQGPWTMTIIANQPEYAVGRVQPE